MNCRSTVSIVAIALLLASATGDADDGPERRDSVSQPAATGATRTDDQADPGAGPVPHDVAQAYRTPYPKSFQLTSDDVHPTPPAVSNTVRLPALGHRSQPPPGDISSEDLASDGFIDRSLAKKRVELMNFVDKDDQQVFLGLTRDGYLGIQVERRNNTRKR